MFEYVKWFFVHVSLIAENDVQKLEKKHLKFLLGKEISQT